MWRWTGFNQGLDLIVTFDHFTLTLKRNHGGGQTTSEHEALMDTHKKRSVAYRVTVVSLNEQKQVREGAVSRDSFGLNDQPIQVMEQNLETLSRLNFLIQFHFLIKFNF